MKFKRDVFNEGNPGKQNQSMKEDSDDYRYSPLKITLIYTFFGSLWILLSDSVVNTLFTSREVISEISILKGWVYVLLTATLVYTLISNLMKNINKKEMKLIESYKELSGTYNKLEKSQNELNSQYKVLLEYKEKLYKLAYQDHLTMIPNRRLFYHDLNILKKGIRENEQFTLLIMDVDNFKYVNDVHGHDFGDKILIKITNHILNLIQENMQLYRIGGDEYAILIKGETDKTVIESFAKAIIKDIKKNILMSSKVSISMSIGIACCPISTQNAEDIVKHADVALYKAKDAGKNTYCFFEVSLKQMLDEKLLFEDKLKMALANKEFILHFQPQVDLNTGIIRGFEALIRWYNPELGFVPPNKFISVAEETKLIVDIGKWILNEAVSFGSRLNQQGDKKYIISVNISVVQWMQDDFVDIIEKTLEAYDFDEQYLELEITESILIHSFDQTIAKLTRLREKGIKIALDDFGTGFSSLNYLKVLPISTLKIDKTFIDDIFDNKSKTVLILNAIIALGHNIGLEVIAEGVETEDQLNYLYENECDCIQGYFYSKPLEQSGITNFIITFNKFFDKNTKLICDCISAN